MSDDLLPQDDYKKFITLYKNGEIPMPFVHDILLMTCEIAGCSHVEDIKEKVMALKDGETVILVREPDNKYDDRAIRIDNAKGGKLGYIPQKRNEVISHLLDNGKHLYGKVISSEIWGDCKWISIVIEIYLKDL